MFFITQNPDISDKSQYFRYNEKVGYVRLSCVWLNCEILLRKNSVVSGICEADETDKKPPGNLKSEQTQKGAKNDNTKSERKGHS